MTDSHTEQPPSTIVVGASRGLGRGIATALAHAGAPVIGVARTATPETPGSPDPVIHEQADATDPATPDRLLDAHDPTAVVLVAGATPTMAALQDQTWETFSVNWHSDVRMTFHWLRAALRRPLPPGSRVVVLSSGAAIQGSPLSGGYAGAKATQRLMAAYAQGEADRAELGITFTTVLPRLTPLTDLGRPAVSAYAKRNGISELDYLERFGTPLTPETAGAAILELVRTTTADLAPEYLLTGDGLSPITAPRSPIPGTPR